MKPDKKIILIIVAGLTIIFAASLIFLYLTDFGAGVRYFLREGEKTRERYERLMCDTDYQALLEGCRELSQMRARGKLLKDEYMVRDNPVAETLHLPQAILDVQPTNVYIGSDGRVAVELGGGLHHFGVYGYPDDYKEPVSDFKYGNRKLIDGLWYYEDGYEEVAHQKRIEALKQRHKQL
ncbi:MAG: hypothetical protein ABIF19_10960 [Planctomycetota bacterium]